MSATSNPVDVHVGNRIRLRRTLLGMSQERLGNALGLTFQQVQKYERGRNRVGASRLYDLSCVLDVPVGFFFAGLPAHVDTTDRPVTDTVDGMAEPEAPTLSSALPTVAQDDLALLSRRETIELVRAYYGIEDSGTRRRVLDLVRSMGASS
ncbi:helix-turn-helix transcriptional regulator [Komagataeibacter oboediens]|uniref:Transcriptional regulator XRE n=1 Tax=Komagataeibacter xylinus NBRC 13693 TaxID=1234668 RepID=A0A0D6QCH3_KOMXY|nr:MULTISPECIES: helix-turn-helix transcriptional regulator [Komagataeibacter]MBV0889072.1 helix-turn-helix domain-containing protein [Komagataeibacter oboediens]MBV1823443.1 helix-turn-helix domain-containing protein [Komagataeibacter oboediens]MCK9820147.1 helix-turn-helix domain-containing protein [Komagataeibacter oboediens]WEQ53126.1 helix-turn-helix transcriptional regulator [Komagataeibacter oboediens]GAO01130.1 transcriptional regulator XRE [Komagataeibacter xylinus NBRC 13693]